MQVLFQDGNRICIVGALSLVSGSRSFNRPDRVERRLARVLAAQLPPGRPVWGVEVLHCAAAAHVVQR